MAPFVHHPQPDHTGAEHVGARTIEFVDGVAEVSEPSLVGWYIRHGYQVTDAAGRDAAAPALNASTEVWRAYASARASTDDERAEVADLGRDELAARYGAPVADPVQG